ncbi:1-pyrroline-5-carboxylate dehydrogenase [Streptacidiphilus sp. MAP12-33]|uniref:aldehyde dehydrogenase family protein n=1 Tax=Streptacidiphilus sp. MAP12-33 TaxID=3156266 RepID=UPI003517F994
MSDFDGIARIDRTYAPASPERACLELRLKELAAADAPLMMTIGGARRAGGGERVDVVQPHHHSARLGMLGEATPEDVGLAVDAALTAGPGWRALPCYDRAAVFLRAAELLAGPWRETVVAATMLGQSMTAWQAEAESRELVRFWRVAARAAETIEAAETVEAIGAIGAIGTAGQTGQTGAVEDGGARAARGVRRRTELRPLEGFVCAVTPFESTAAAGRLATAPALAGNTVVWRPAPAQTLSATCVLRVLEAAGLPPGVINMVTGEGQALARAALGHPRLAGLHFAGEAADFHGYWCEVGRHLDRCASRPRLVGETGGKGFLLAHPGADPAVLRTALVQGAFAYQGQRRSAVSRAYLPRVLWQAVKAAFLDEVRALAVGDVADLSNTMGALVDAHAHERAAGAIARARTVHSLDVVVGGHSDDAIGYFVEPTVITGTDPRQELFTAGLRGPVLAVHVYDDARFEQTLDLVAAARPAVAAGSVIASDRSVIAQVRARLRGAADALAVNGVEPSGAAQAGGKEYLMPWMSRRSVEETLIW